MAAAMQMRPKIPSATMPDLLLQQAQMSTVMVKMMPRMALRIRHQHPELASSCRAVRCIEKKNGREFRVKECGADNRIDGKQPTGSKMNRACHEHSKQASKDVQAHPAIAPSCSAPISD